MKSERFKLVCLGNRGGMFYCKDTQTGSRTSLKTFDRKEAERLVFHKNEADGSPTSTGASAWRISRRRTPISCVAPGAR